MSIKRWDAKRDANEGPIIEAAKNLGVRVWRLDEPCDCMVLIGGRMYPAEIKSEAGELTEKQVIFRREVLDAGGTYITWRSVDEMISDVQRLRVKANVAI